MTADGVLHIRLLGRFAVLHDRRELPAADFGGRKVRVLLRILATRRGSFVSHDALSEMVWADRPPADPAANLQVLANRCRRALGRPGVVVTGPGGYSLTGGEVCVVDAEQFLDAVTRAHAASGQAALSGFAAALAGWGGEPLAEDAFADWAVSYRDRLTQAHQLALERAAGLAIELGEIQMAVEFAVTAAGGEPLREAAALVLVRALAAAGDRVAALERYEQYRRALAEELGLDPSAEAVAVQAHLLRGPPAVSRAHPMPHPRSEFTRLPFIGRAGELDRLESVITAGGTVLLAGQSGSGKSRLLEALARRLPLVSVRAFLAERDEPWSLARNLLREVIAEDLTATADLPAAIRAALYWLVPELERTGPVTATDSESRRALLAEATTRMLAGQDRPVVIDDLQWADPSSLTLLEAALARRSTTAVVVAFRPEEIGARPDVADLLNRWRPAAATLELQPFTTSDLAQLTADAALAAALGTAPDPTPLAVSEVLRALAAEGAIEATAHQQWRVLTPNAILRAAQLGTEGQRQAIRTRSNAQPAPAREVLNLLALLAREAPTQLLAQAAGIAEPDVFDALGSLTSSGLARQGEQGWATGHDMISEVVARQLPPSERGRLHAALAAALQTDETDAGEVARHWVEAANPNRAAHAYLRAAERALTAFADTEAAALADAGLAASPPAELAAGLGQVRAQARARLGDIPGARADLHNALRAHPRGPDRARLLAQLAILASGADDLIRAAELTELALIEAGAHPAARAQALEVAAILDMNLDRPQQAEQRAADALTLYQRIGDANGAARILDGRAMATFLDGQIRVGTELLQRAANLFEDSGDLIHVVTPRSTAGHGLVFADDSAHGLAHTTAALELARTLGHPEGQTYSLWHTTEALAALDEADQALDTGHEALTIATRLGHRGWTATAWRAIGIAHYTAGDLDNALHAFESSLEVSEHLNLFASWAAARCALVHIAQGQPNKAAPLIARALRQGPPLGHYEGRLAQIELAAARNDPTTADLANQALRLADEGGMRQGRPRLVELANSPEHHTQPPGPSSVQ